MTKILTSFKIIVVVLVIAISSVANGQTNTWTLVKGADSSSAPAVYGKEGKPSHSNTPGPRTNPLTWVDAHNNLWMFGGGVDGEFDYKGDLWKYSPHSKEWTWISGSDTNNSYGNYSVKGIPSDSVMPANRSAGVSWTDSAGNLWLFGGVQTFVAGDDVWKYDIHRKQWTWVNGRVTSGNNPPPIPVYGTKGIGAITNTPGTRVVATGWTGKDGLFWLYGGVGVDDNLGYGDYNDLWNYNSATNEWTWVSGATAVHGTANYGIQGTPSSANNPGSRFSAAHWVDATGNLWLFGGSDQNATYFKNDLWKYNISTNEWTWIKGSDVINQNGIYGTLGIPADTNTPGAREFSAYWTDANGDFWLFGGQNFGSLNPDNSMLNDLWKYSVATNQWTWMGGSTQVDPENVQGSPYARFQAACWTDNKGSFWMYGGQVGNTFADGLWKYTPDLTDATTNITATINPVNSASLTVYPNPSNGQFTVSLLQASQLTVYNSLGQLIVTQNMQAGQQLLNLGYQPSGVYSLIVTNGQTQQAIKLVVE